MALLACVSMVWVGLGWVYDSLWSGPCFAIFLDPTKSRTPCGRVGSLGGWQDEYCDQLVCVLVLLVGRYIVEVSPAGYLR